MKRFSVASIQASFIAKLAFVICAVVFASGCAHLNQSENSVPATQTQAAQTRAANILSAKASPRERLVAAGIEQTNQTFYYDSDYTKIAYPQGDVPLERGVCTDVVIRALRKTGVDLQQAIHEDMTGNFKAYPAKWGLTKPDANIDHRRVPNLMTYFERHGKALAVTNNSRDYQPGDIVAWQMEQAGRTHIGLVIDEFAQDSDSSSRSTPLVVHNIGAGAKIENVLFARQIIGHYRYFTDASTTSQASTQTRK